MRHYVEGLNKDEYRFFDSLEDLLERVDACRHEKYSEIQAERVCRPDFVGRHFENLDHVLRECRRAWPEGLDIIEGMLREIDQSNMPRPVNRRRKPSFRPDDGDEICYDRLRDGRDFWRVSRRQVTHGISTATIVVDVGGHCGIHYESLLWRGAAAVALTKLLEEAGYRIELWSITAGKRVYISPSGSHAIATCLKRTGDPLDISTLVNCVSGWFFRTILFQAKCMSYTGRRGVKGNLGYHFEPNSGLLDRFTHPENRTLISGVWSRDAAVRLIRSTLESLADQSASALARV